MKQIISRSLRTGGAILLASALALTGVAVAQTDPPPATSDQSDRLAEHVSDVRRPGLRARLRGLVGRIAESIGVTAREIADGLADGQTVAEIAVSNGSTGAAVVADLMNAAEERLANAVSRGRIDQDQADDLAARLEARLTQLVDTPHPGREVIRNRVRHRVRTHIGTHIGRQLASELGLTPHELREALADGATVAQLAADADVDLDAFISRAVEAFEKALRERLGLG